MGLFNKKKKATATDRNDILGWLAFAVAVLGWLLDALKKFPATPKKPEAIEETAGDTTK